MKWRWLYPKDWDSRLARECKERAGWRCEECGIPHNAPIIDPWTGEVQIDSRTGKVKRAQICAAHLDHDPWNPRPRLRALCRSCHARYDYSARERARWLALERERHRWLLRRWEERQRRR